MMIDDLIKRWENKENTDKRYYLEARKIAH